MYQSWLQEDNIRDWCISRQLWWGQRIPAWFLKTEEEGESEQPQSTSWHLIASASLWLLLGLVLQIADIFAVTFASWKFVLFDFASTPTSLLLLSQVCKMYRTCFCARSRLASQSHLQCAAVLPCLCRCNNPRKQAIHYFNVHFNNYIICLVISNWFLSVRLKIN